MTAGETLALDERFQRDGYAIVAGVASHAQCDALAAQVLAATSRCVGSRSLLQHQWCVALARRLKSLRKLSGLIPPTWKAVQCTYFNKSAARNWLVPVHQDTVIPVAERIHHPDLCAWSVKEGVHFVQPPAVILNELVAVRLHLDACPASNGPLRVVPGSHRLGLVSGALTRAGLEHEVSCVAERGAALVMKPLLFHSSGKSFGTSQRRVFHFVFGPDRLPCGLRWAHAV